MVNSMIIKSMARKAPTFGQLVDYIGRSAEGSNSGVFSRNLYGSGLNHNQVADQFLQNHNYLPKRLNGNALYHEVIVLERQDHRSTEEVSKALIDLAEHYCRRRAPDNLAWGRVHFDTDYPHLHLMISSNAVRSDRRVRLDRKGFAAIQQTMDRYRLTRHPELVGTPVYMRDEPKQLPKLTRNEGEAIRRTKAPSRKQEVHELFKSLFATAISRNDLQVRLETEGFELYKRGQSWGVVHVAGGKRYRLKTLGLSEAFDRIPERDADRQNSHCPVDQKATSSATVRDHDARASKLLKQREHLEKIAEVELDGFDQDTPANPSSHSNQERDQ